MQAGISIVIPTYNYAGFIRESIDSVLPQMADDDELIVVDDGSSDDTRARLEVYIGQEKIRYVYQENAGVGAARNKGVSLASRQYLYFIDADDRLLPGGLDRLRQKMAACPDCAMVFAAHESVAENGNCRVHHQKTISENCQKNFIDYVIGRRFSIANGGVALVRRDVMLQYPYPESIRVSEDFCVYAWVLANHVCAAFDTVIVRVRKHEASLRNQLSHYEAAVEKLPDILFDAEKLPQPLLGYKRRFRCNRLLSLFRAQYLAGEFSKARHTYRAAIVCRPSNLFRLSYLRKYLRTFL